MPLRNDSEKALTGIPISVDVLDAKGKSVFKNNLPGLDPGLVSMPDMAPKSEAYWVNDQILATGKPKSVKVKVGASDATYSGDLPDIVVAPPKLEGRSRLRPQCNRFGDQQDWRRPGPASALRRRDER